MTGHLMRLVYIKIQVSLSCITFIMPIQKLSERVQLTVLTSHFAVVMCHSS